MSHELKPPARLRRLLERAGYRVDMVFERSDGAPMTDHDRRALHALLVGYEVDERVLSTDEKPV